MEIYHQYVRVRRNFGRHAKFVDGGAEVLADIRPNAEHAAACVPKSPVVTVTQCVPEMSEHEADTTAVIYANRAMSHLEGGWPKDVDATEAEHTIRCAGGQAGPVLGAAWGFAAGFCCAPGSSLRGSPCGGAKGSSACRAAHGASAQLPGVTRLWSRWRCMRCGLL
jgi:hypothetical protein